MFNFKHNSFSALKKQSGNTFSTFVQKVLCETEELVQTFDGKDVVLFVTDKRLIFLNFAAEHNATEDFFFVPYSRIRLYSANLSAHSFQKSTIHLQIPDTDVVSLEFTHNSDAENLCRLLAQFSQNI